MLPLHFLNAMLLLAYCSLIGSIVKSSVVCMEAGACQVCTI